MLKATDGNTAVYYTRGFELISRREGAAASYYVYDGGLSVRALTNEAGTVTDTLVFDAFGNETGRTGTTDNPYGFQGEEQDATGLYYLRARYMDPVTGTFITMDTYGGSLSDPMSLHKYLFANSNPVRYSDPSGHDVSILDAMISCGILGMLCSATIFWIDNALHPEKNPNDFDYLAALVGGFISGFLSGYLGFVFEGAGFILSWNALIPLGYLLFVGGIGYLVKSIGKILNTDGNPVSIRGIGIIIESFGDGMMGPLYDILSFNSDAIAFVYDLLNSLTGE